MATQPGNKPRDITLEGTGKLAETLGMTRDRANELDKQIGGMISRNCSTKDILTHFNEVEVVSDAEWTAIVFALGVYQGRMGW